jgi:hypothetical protein
LRHISVRDPFPIVDMADMNDQHNIAIASATLCRIRRGSVSIGDASAAGSVF